MKKRSAILLYFLFLIIFLECVYKYTIMNNLFSINTLSVILFSLPISFILTFLCTIFSNRINKILTVFFTIIITFMFMSQLVYFKFYDSMYSTYSIIMGTKQVFGGFFGSIMEMTLSNIWYLLIMLIPLLGLLILNKSFNYNRNKYFSITMIGSFLICIVLETLLITFDKKELYSFNRLFNDTHAPMKTINKTGLLTMEFLDFERFLFGYTEKLLSSESTEKNYNSKEYNIMNIDFDTLINKEKDTLIKSMHKYFNSKTPTNKNDYTGIFKGKNLIYITAESLDKIAISETLTPTLYKIFNNGIVFKNYYQPLYPVSTSDGEYMFLNGMIPKEGTWSMYNSYNLYLPYALGNVFKKEDYEELNAYHNNAYDFYYRYKSHENLGFAFQACGNGLEKKINCSIWPESDLEMINASFDDYMNAKNFVTYYMTVSGHLEYSSKNNAQSKANEEYTKNLPYSSRVSSFIGANMTLDKALESLINELEERNILKDTVIVVSPDHFPYGLTSEELNEISKTNRNDRFELYHTSLAIYNSEIKNKIQVKKYMSSIDVLPTIYNLFGIDYDSRLLSGKDIFSNDEGLVILSDRSWINEKGSYNSITNKFTPFVSNVDQSYIDSINKEVYQRFTISSLLLYSNDNKYLDYYKVLGL